MITPVYISGQVTTDNIMPLTVAQAKTYANVYHSSDDTLFADLIQSAIDQIETHSGLILRAATGIAYLGSWISCIHLDKRPVVSITHIKYYDEDGNLQTVDSANYDLDTSGVIPVIMFNPDYDYPELDDSKINPIIVTLSMGYALAAVPKRVIQWLRYYVNDMYNHRDNPIREKKTASDRLIDTISPHWV